MLRIAKIELKNLLFSSGTLIGIIILFLLMNLSNVGSLSKLNDGDFRPFIYEAFYYSKSDFLEAFDYNAVQVFHEAIRGRYVSVFLPLAVSISGINFFCWQRKSKFYYFELSRASKKSYIYGKLLANVMVSILIVFAGCLLFWLELQLVLPSSKEYIEAYGYEMVAKSSIASSQSVFKCFALPEFNFIYVLLRIFFVSLVACLSSLLTRFLCHVFGFNKFVGLSGTILSFCFINEILLSLNNPALASLMPGALIAPDVVYLFSKDYIHFGIYIIYITALISGAVLLNAYLDKRGFSRDE